MKFGIIGCRHGLRVLLPAFRADPRCEVVALAGTDEERTTVLAQQNNIPKAFGDWRGAVNCAGLDAVAIAVPPQLQPEIIYEALRQGLAVFAEKPLARDAPTAIGLLRAASECVTAVDFGFPEIPAWQLVRTLLHNGAIGKLRSVHVNWNVETNATRLRFYNWKTASDQGGGALGNFASHSLHYLEWFCGSIVGLSARLSSLPDDKLISTGVALHLQFLSGAAGTYALSCGSYSGSGHRLEFYGDEGTLTLVNSTLQYTLGFEVKQAKRGIAGPLPLPMVEGDLFDLLFPSTDLVAPTARLARRFIDAFEAGTAMSPGFAAGARVQELIDTVRRSHLSGSWLSVPRNTLEA